MSIFSDIKFACATDDGKNFTKEHFGSAKYYLIYEFDTENNRIKFLEKIANDTLGEEIHSDPKKAKSVSSLMKRFGIFVLITVKMGPNVVRMRKNFVPVISREWDIEKTLEKLPSHIDVIKEELTKPAGENREIIYIAR